MELRTIQVLFDVAVIVGVLWFWPRRARPALLAADAEPLALRLGALATAVVVGAVLVHLVAAAAGADGVAANAVRLLGGLAWLLIVGLGYPEYRFLRHATGSKPAGR